jgi:NodT family efflux transporter outer membrane factor (OMF) lipoprotein
LGLLAALCAEAGCVVGPNYTGPPDAAPRAEHAAAFQRAGSVSNADPQAQWWTSLGDETLDRLVRDALAASPDLEAARARVLQARAGLSASRAGRLPTTGAAALYLRTNGIADLAGAGGANGAGSQAFQIYSAALDATWEIDLFGGQARAIEGARAKSEAAKTALQGAATSLEAEVAQSYVRLRGLQRRAELSRRQEDIEQSLLDKMRQRRAGGSASDLDIESLINQVRTTQAAAQPIRAGISEELDRLAILTGQEPGALDSLLKTPAPPPLPPAAVAVGDPAGLLRRRPDIREAERRLAAANALVGARTAGYFPKVTLLGAVGFTSPDASTLFRGANFAPTAAPILQWAPFDFGRVRASVSEAKGERAEAVATYRRTVLAALDDAETALSRYGRQRDGVERLVQVERSADSAAAMQALRKTGGTASDLDLLQADRRRVQAELDVADAETELTQDFIALEKSLGLGLAG